MSSLPGYTLEAYVAWDHNVVIIGRGDPNPSLNIAEALGTASRTRPRFTEEQFKPVVAVYEPYRDHVESRLQDFDSDYQSWRDYAGYAFDIPSEVFDQAQELIKQIQGE